MRMMMIVQVLLTMLMMKTTMANSLMKKMPLELQRTFLLKMMMKSWGAK